MPGLGWSCPVGRVEHEWTVERLLNGVPGCKINMTQNQLFGLVWLAGGLGFHVQQECIGFPLTLRQTGFLSKGDVLGDCLLVVVCSSEATSSSL